MKVELSILVHPSDLGFLEPTLRHQLRHFQSSRAIGRRVVVADFALADDDAPGNLRSLVDSLRIEGLVDDVIDVDWNIERAQQTMARWFGSPEVRLRAAHRRSRYQYAFSIDVALAPLILHLDSDVLFWGDLDWLEEAPSRFINDPTLLAIVPMAGPPQALTRRDWLLGPSRGQSHWPMGAQYSTDFTTRHVLFHRERLMGLLPLLAQEDQHFESSVGEAMSNSGFRRLTTIDASSLVWHPHDHNANHIRHVKRLIRVVESGGYPYRRWGKPWDISTVGRGFLPWLLARRRQQDCRWGESPNPNASDSGN